MNTNKIIVRSINLGCILFILFTVLPVKLSLSSNVIVALFVLGLVNLFIHNSKIEGYDGLKVFFITIPFLIYAIGLINTSNMDYGLRFLSKNLSFLVIPIIFFSLGQHIKKAIIYKAFLIGLGLTNIYLIYLFIYYFNFGTRFYMVVTTDIYHSTYLGMYNLFAYWICVHLFIQKNHKIYVLVALFFLISAILTSARIIFMVSIVSIITTGVLLLKSAVHRVISTVIAACVCVVLMFTIPSIKQKFSQFLEIDKIGFDENNYQSISSRFGKIEASVRVIGHNFWTGTGTGDLQDELIKEYKAMGFLMGYKYKYNPHNQFLDNLARNGIFGGTICLVALYLFPLYYSLKRKALLLTAFISVAALVSLTESILDVHKGITFYTFFLSLIFYSQIYKHNKVK